MSKKIKLEQAAKRKELMETLDQAAKTKIEEGSSTSSKKEGLMEIVRYANPNSKKTSEAEAEAEAKAKAKAKAESVSEPVEEESEPTKEVPPRKEPEESPQWAMDLVASQNNFQALVEKVLMKTGMALDEHEKRFESLEERVENLHEKRFESLEERVENLEAWKGVAMKAEKAKAEVKADADAEPDIEVRLEIEPELGAVSENEAETESVESELKPATCWRARIVNGDEVSYSEPFVNIYVANKFATVDFDVEPVFGWIDRERRFIREMTEEELKKYGRYF